MAGASARKNQLANSNSISLHLKLHLLIAVSTLVYRYFNSKQLLDWAIINTINAFLHNQLRFSDDLRTVIAVAMFDFTYLGWAALFVGCISSYSLWLYLLAPIAATFQILNWLGWLKAKSPAKIRNKLAY